MRMKGVYRVTDHAILRWMERVLLIDAQAAWREMGRTGAREQACGELTRYIARRDGLDLVEINDDILSPTVRAGIDAGLAKIADGDILFAIREGAVCTLIVGDGKDFGRRRRVGGSPKRAAIAEIGGSVDTNSRPYWEKKTGRGRSAYFQKVKRFAKERDEARR